MLKKNNLGKMLKGIGMFEKYLVINNCLFKVYFHNLKLDRHLSEIYSELLNSMHINWSKTNFIGIMEILIEIKEFICMKLKYCKSTANQII